MKGRLPDERQNIDLLEANLQSLRIELEELQGPLSTAQRKNKELQAKLRKYLLPGVQEDKKNDVDYCIE
eukprot:CAMPEP_0168323684 /NCGR_PEP_ID=MMETSP0213-20121227/3628_1 /TAXON_ID=151035 /ORGANISM="Euplotes harpa, Strain FSP1.4" /LENGTH=68 /DNA_ID=CAMNT_0008325803 /DNA_START=702 /DNA_END=908 /DNA_ORIENTATION=+